MPLIETPFFTDLRPAEELHLCPGAGGQVSMTNSFSAIVTNILLIEEAMRLEGGETGKDSDATEEPVRLSLIATVVEKGTGQPLRITLASHIFCPSSKSSSPANALDRVHSLSLKVPLQFSSKGFVESLSVVAERSPHELLHPVTGETIFRPTSAKKNSGAGRDSTGSTYSGPRRFVVRLSGVQQTELSAEQVLVITQQS